jgi:septal ring factor EnvC (AmiA/AmiB activator)
MILGLLTAGLAVGTVGLAIELANYRTLIKAQRGMIRKLEEDCDDWRSEAEITSAKRDELDESLARAENAIKDYRGALEQHKTWLKDTMREKQAIEQQIQSGPEYYNIEQDNDSYIYRLYAVYESTHVQVKVFDTDDKDYNLGLAEELKEKLEEKI